jgi:hypothetical protein
MKIKLKDIKAGDFVYCTGMSGFCHDSTEKVIKVTVQYDPKSGKPFSVIHLSGVRKFDSRDGGAMNPPLAYYIEPTEQAMAQAEQKKKDKEEAKRDKRYKRSMKEKEEVLSKLTKREREILGYE